MTDSPSDTATVEEVEEAAIEPLSADATAYADAVGGEVSMHTGIIKVHVEADRWVESVRTLRDTFGFIYFSFLSAIDWTNDVRVGDPLSDETEERFEILAMIGDLGEGKFVTVSTTLDKDGATIDSLTPVFPGANWHEREATDMFGIEFAGHPDPGPLYLPDGFLGHPLRKDYPLLSREVKPWPGTVDVEGLPDSDDDDDSSDAPSTENPEA